MAAKVKEEAEVFTPEPQAVEIIQALNQQITGLQFQLTLANLSNSKLREKLAEMEAGE